MSRAVVLLSGGLDSATVLAVARSQHDAILALTMHYGQRHAVELDAARALATHFGVARHDVLEVPFPRFGASALTDSIDVPKDGLAGEGIPITYVPARNTVFLSLGLAYAEAWQAQSVYIGVSSVDYSGYPDCRPEFIDAFQHVIEVGTKAGVEGNPIRIVAPLLRLSKADTIRLGLSHGLDYGMTTSCYDPVGASPCGGCDSCRIRAAAFAEVGMVDPRA